ncbi:MAG: hypothetical protein ACE5JN_03675 [Candidatus Methylomirabilia bacterium]
MPRVHDRGGWPGAGPVDRAEHELSRWEKRIDAIVTLLSSPDKRVMRVDELRRAIEGIEPKKYAACTCYERWLLAVETLMIEKGILTREEIGRRLQGIEARR